MLLFMSMSMMMCFFCLAKCDNPTENPVGWLFGCLVVHSFIQSWWIFIFSVYIGHKGIDFNIIDSVLQQKRRHRHLDLGQKQKKKDKTDLIDRWMGRVPESGMKNSRSFIIRILNQTKNTNNFSWLRMRQFTLINN